MNNIYEAVIGLEVHIELKTATKAFCACPTAFGEEPNSQCCPVCSGQPGTLPVLNKKMLEFAVIAGLATNCSINHQTKCARKNYFYPDLPKGYQISQDNIPLCQNGHIDIESEGGKKRIGITRIHIEEDAGKLIHSEDGTTLIDLNRCGVPLIEIVSAPDMRSAAEAVAYLKKLRTIMLYLGISDAKMNEGSLRCDVNISLRKKGETEFGTRAEIKNINSFNFAATAINYEINRQSKLLNAGENVKQETRRFNTKNGTTHSLRSKENSADYRYFADPDLPLLIIEQEKIDVLKAALPMLPDERTELYTSKHGLTQYQAQQIIADTAAAHFFEEAAAYSQQPKTLAKLIISEVFSFERSEGEQIKMNAKAFAEVADMFFNGEINNLGVKALLQALWQTNAKNARQLVESLGLAQKNDEEYLTEVVRQVLAENPKMLADYKSGKQAAFKGLMGAAMKKTKGCANPKMLNKILSAQLIN